MQASQAVLLVPSRPLSSTLSVWPGAAAQLIISFATSNLDATHGGHASPRGAGHLACTVPKIASHPHPQPSAATWARASPVVVDLTLASISSAGKPLARPPPPPPAVSTTAHPLLQGGAAQCQVPIQVGPGAAAGGTAAGGGERARGTLPIPVLASIATHTTLTSTLINRPAGRRRDSPLFPTHTPFAVPETLLSSRLASSRSLVRFPPRTRASARVSLWLPAVPRSPLPLAVVPSAARGPLHCRN